MNLMLIIVLAILVFFVVVGVIKGFIKMLFATLALAITIILALLATDKMAGFIKNNTRVYDKVYEKFLDFTEERIDGKFNDYKQAQGGAIEKLPIPSILKAQLSENNNEETYAKLGVVSFSDYIAASLANIVIKALAFLILFVLIAVGLRILFAILDTIAKLPILRQANKFLGFIFGLIQGLVIVWIVFVFITFISTSGLGQAALEQINDSEFLAFLYNNNYLIKIVSGVFTSLIG